MSCMYSNDPLVNMLLILKHHQVLYFLKSLNHKLDKKQNKM